MGKIDLDWVVYILLCSDNTLYTGITNNLPNRLKMHNSGKGSKYCRSRLPLILKAFWVVKDRSEASKLESKIKKMKRSDKLLLIETYENNTNSRRNITSNIRKL